MSTQVFMVFLFLRNKNAHICFLLVKDLLAIVNKIFCCKYGCILYPAFLIFDRISVSQIWHLVGY